MWPNLRVEVKFIELSRTLLPLLCILLLPVLVDICWCIYIYLNISRYKHFQNTKTNTKYKILKKLQLLSLCTLVRTNCLHASGLSVTNKYLPPQSPSSRCILLAWVPTGDCCEVGHYEQLRPVVLMSFQRKAKKAVRSFCECWQSSCGEWAVLLELTSQVLQGAIAFVFEYRIHKMIFVWCKCTKEDFLYFVQS